MAKSIVQKQKCCYVCGCTFGLHDHHCYEGVGRRKISEQYGFKVWLCGKHHNLSNEGVHFNKALDLKLKRICQKIFERTHSREEFIKLIGRNYLEE